MIDSHCHLDHEPLFGNLNDVLIRSKEAGITKLFIVVQMVSNFSIPIFFDFFIISLILLINGSWSK